MKDQNNKAIMFYGSIKQFRYLFKVVTMIVTNSYRQAVRFSDNVRKWSVDHDFELQFENPP